jgi:hypothetical protein
MAGGGIVLQGMSNFAFAFNSASTDPYDYRIICSGDPITNGTATNKVGSSFRAYGTHVWDGSLNFFTYTHELTVYGTGPSRGDVKYNVPHVIGGSTQAGYYRDSTLMGSDGIASLAPTSVYSAPQAVGSGALISLSPATSGGPTQTGTGSEPQSEGWTGGLKPVDAQSASVFVVGATSIVLSAASGAVSIAGFSVAYTPPSGPGAAQAYNLFLRWDFLLQRCLKSIPNAYRTTSSWDPAI